MTTPAKSLLPCPFCGAEAVDAKLKYPHPSIGSNNWVGCQSCGITFSYENRQLSYDNWNTRFSPPPSTPGKAELIEAMSQRVKENINQQIRDYLRQEHNNFGVVNIDNDAIAQAIYKTIQPYLRGE